MGDQPVARRTDPQTSWDAAHAVDHVRESQQEVLDVLRKLGPMTDEALVRQIFGQYGHQSASGIRTRRSELVDMGLVRDSGKRVRGTTGRMMIVWDGGLDMGVFNRIIPPRKPEPLPDVTPGLAGRAFPLVRNEDGTIGVTYQTCEGCGERYAVLSDHVRTFDHRRYLAKVGTLDGQGVTVDEPKEETYKYTVQPKTVAFGEQAICPRCKGFRKSHKGVKADWCEDPHQSGKCIRCNGFGIVPNIGPVNTNADITSERD